MSDKPLTVFAEIDDPELAAEFRATLEREQRTMKVVTTLAIRDYIARSKAEAKAARAASKSQPVSA